MSQDDEGRFDELECRMAFQDDLIENLNQVVARQDREILQLQRQLEELQARFNELDESAAPAGPASGFETPPHY